jgi:hypothetical protein
MLDSAEYGRLDTGGSSLMAGAALLLDGVSPGRASTPDTAALDIVGDLDVRVHLAMDDWTPAAATAAVSKWLTVGVDQRSWTTRINTSGTLALFWSENGTAVLSATSTAAPTVADGEALWLRYTLDVNNGAAGRDITFYTSTDGETWTQLGTTVTQAGVTSIHSGTAEVNVGAYNNGGSERLAGRVFSAEIRSGINGTIVANPDFGVLLAGTTSFFDSTGKPWTVNSPAVIDVGKILVATDTGSQVWIDSAAFTDADDFPFDILVAGEVMRVLSITGTTSPQEFTVQRAVNGVVKTHALGTDVALAKPSYLSL